MSCCLWRWDQGCVLSRIPAANKKSHSIQTFATQTAAQRHDSLITSYSHLFAMCWFPVSFPCSRPQPTPHSAHLFSFLLPHFPAAAGFRWMVPTVRDPDLQWSDWLSQRPAVRLPWKLVDTRRTCRPPQTNTAGTRLPSHQKCGGGWGEGGWGWSMAKTTNFICVFVSPSSPSFNLAYSGEHASSLIQMDTVNAFSMRSW